MSYRCSVMTLMVLNIAPGTPDFHKGEYSGNFRNAAPWLENSIIKGKAYELGLFDATWWCFPCMAARRNFSLEGLPFPLSITSTKEVVIERGIFIFTNGSQTPHCHPKTRNLDTHGARTTAAAMRAGGGASKIAWDRTLAGPKGR